MNFLNDFILLLKARYPIIYISTYEEERIEYIIKLCTKKYVPRTYYSWDFINGYQGNPNDSGFAAKNPLEALELVEKLTSETASVFVLKDYDNFLKDISIIRKLKNLNKDLKTQQKTNLQPSKRHLKPQGSVKLCQKTGSKCAETSPTN